MLGQKLKAENPSLDLIDLSLGNPDVESPPSVDASLIELLNKKEKSSHRYMDAAGLPEIREFLASQLSISEKTAVTKDSVYLTVGAAGGLQILLRSLLDAGDEAIIFAPYFPEYMPYILNYDATPVVCPSDENHKPDLEFFANCITNKTKVIILNSPNNPSGVVYDEEYLKKLFAILTERSQSLKQAIHVIADEPYCRITYPQVHFPRILQLYPFSWIVRSFSKDLCLAGERIGYIATSENLYNQVPDMINIFRNASRIIGFVSAPRLMQRLIPYIFDLKVDVSIYEKRMTKFIQILKENDFKVTHPQAGFFVFPQSPIKDDRLFCEKLIQYGVLCVPGASFGAPGYFRASLTQDIELVEEAARKIVECTKKLLIKHQS